MATLPATTIDAFKTHFHGEVLLPGNDAYEHARKLWNAAIDKRPALIARSRTTLDVVHAVEFARENELPLAVRGGGHNIAGTALCDDGIVIDLSFMRAVKIDQDRRQATILGGATLADLDLATQARGLATPVGINSITGVAGLTLGGGFGWLSRKHGVTIDNLVRAEVVTAEGKVVHADADQHPDLFWALRGGGGNFGVVTRFEFGLHRVGPEVLSGLIVYPLAEAKSVLREYREFMKTAPDALSVWALLRQAPPLPFLPERVHGTPIVALALLYSGEPKDGERHLGSLKGFGASVGAHVGVQPYAAWQQAFDPLLAAGARNYWKSHNLSTIEDGLLDVVLNAVEELPSPQCEIIFAALGGAASIPEPESTAYPHRDTQFVMNVHGRWEDPSDDELSIGWARGVFNASTPFATGGVYINFMTADEGDRMRAAYGPNYDRLVRVKRVYDPDNLFRTNHNITPVAPSRELA